MDNNLYTATTTVQHSILTASFFFNSTGRKMRSVSRLDYPRPAELKFQKYTSYVINSSSLENDVQLKPRPSRRRPPLAPVLDGGSEDDAAGTAADVATSPSQRHHSSTLCAKIEKLVLFGRYGEALELFDFLRFRDHFRNVAFRSVTYDKLVSACIVLRSIHDVKAMFQHMIDTGFEFNQYMRNRVLLMHVKCGMMVDAHFLFDEMPQRNEASWNIMISGLVDSGRYVEAFHTFLLMWGSEDSDDAGTRIFTPVICASAGLESASYGRQLHSCVLKLGLSHEVHVSCALIDMYCKCGCIEEAWWVFAEMPEKTVVGWNTIISGYALNGYSEEALEVYYEMRDCGSTKMDQCTYSIIFRIFSRLASLESVRQTHASLVRNGFGAYTLANTSLIDFYGKWGRMDYARNVFDNMPRKNVIHWNALIGGYKNHGRGSEAIQTFKEMREERIVPNHVTFLSLLGACSNSGLGGRGWEFFETMSSHHNVKPRAMHYGCMIEILGRDGLLQEAFDLINDAPFRPTANMWGALLTACRFHRHVELGKVAAEKLFEMDLEEVPWKKIGNYIDLLNIYISSGRVEEAGKVLEVMNRRGLEIPRPCSWIEIKREPYMFEFNDRSHSESEKVYREIDRVMELVGKFGYVTPNDKLKSLLPDDKLGGGGEWGEERVKRIYHSEKLAVAMGLISTSKSASLQVVQRHRMCMDCHKVIKLIALITGRDITVRDFSRFHHFKDGDCSCGDYW